MSRATHKHKNTQTCNAQTKIESSRPLSQLGVNFMAGLVFLDFNVSLAAIFVATVA